jgi:hypothetical protein
MHQKVLARDEMPVFTSDMCARRIHLMSDSLKVGWINTARRPAKMIKLQAFWNWAFKQFIDKPVNHHGSAGRIFVATYCGASVTLRIARASPQPAT